MRGRLLAGLLAAGMLCCPVGAEEPFQVGARAAILIEAESGEVLFGQEIHKELPMASTTKIMTALLTLEEKNLWQEFTVSPEAIRVEGSSMGLREGDTVSLYALAAGMLLSSGNDAAGAAAVRVAGSREKFVERMNRRAALLGMNGTHFETPSGLDGEKHYSTAFDLALLAREALRNPLFYELCSQTSVSVTFGNPPYERRLRNHNKLLSLYPEAVGVKTGFTKKAGRCLVSAAERDGVRLIAVTLGCPDDWNTHRMLYERYFPLTERVEMPFPECSFPLAGGEQAQVRAVRQSPFSYVRRKDGSPELTARIYARKFYYAPVKKGDILGKIVYYKGERAVGERNLLAAETVEACEAPRRFRLFG